MKQRLADTLVELLTSVTPDESLSGALRVESVSLSLPIEVQVDWKSGEQPEFLASLPRWRWTTVFDEQRGRLEMYCKSGGLA